MKALYERLRECLKLAQESATKEANRQKWLYNRRVGAVESARLLLWLANYGEPVRCILMVISDTLPGMVPGQQLDDSGDGLLPVRETMS